MSEKQSRVGRWARVLTGTLQGQRLLVVDDFRHEGETGVSLRMPRTENFPPRPGYYTEDEFEVEDE